MSADPELEVDPRAEALLFAAARAQLVAEKLRPLLEAGETVLLDRYIDSSLAYQGGGRELGRRGGPGDQRCSAPAGCCPTARSCCGSTRRTGLARIADRDADRLELAGGEFFARVAQTYDELAAAEPDRFIVLDATQPPDTVLAAALKALS